MTAHESCSTRHSLAWLAVSNLAGLWLATLLLFPNAGNWIAPFTYGRWVTVHLNGNLYGWCSVPLLALLFRLYAPARGFKGRDGMALRVWSASLLLSCLLWLGGHSSGKLFMEWTGISRVLFPLNMLFLLAVLLAGFVEQRERGFRWGLKAGLLAVLAAIPFLMYWAADPAIYPPANPASGGATGGSLLGSTLGIVVIILICPLMLGLRPDHPRGVVALAAILAVHFAVFLALDHGDRSHHEWTQVVALFSLLIWWPLLTLHLRQFIWPRGTKRWLAALCAWGGFLLATSLPTFLPGILEAWKFTNALVSHSHLAMAGMLTSFNMVILTVVSGAAPLDRPRPFWMWNMACAAHVIVLLVLGVLEAKSPATLFRPDMAATALYGIRWAAGAVMLAASVEWWLATRRLGT